MIRSPRAKLLFACTLALAACRMEDAEPARGVRSTPPRPDGGTPVPAGTDLQAAIDAARDGATLWLEPGTHQGPIVIARNLTLWGPAQAVVTSRREGTTIKVEGRGTRLMGFTVDGSGGRFDLLDAAIHVGADDVLVEGVGIREALFGILVEKAQRAVLRGNDVRGTGDPAMGLRGDTIRLWETKDCVIEANVVHDGRDMVVWYSDRARLLRNTVFGGRYGTHFMYSRQNLVEGNHYVGNVVGVFVMYSHDVQLRGNLISRCSGAAGIGIGLKESGNLVIEKNRLLANTIGVFVDTSPLDRAEHNRIEANLIRLSETAVSFHGGAARNRFADNSFRDNQNQVRVDGGTDAREAEWIGNAWDDYQGYDLDGDGVGDLPYEVRSLSGQLTSKYPELAFFHGTPTLFLVDLTGKVMPIFRPKTLLIDAQPRVRPAQEPSHAR
ncbi:MAG: nitrous oxide reductase family maturation protein NosD [Planctomycetes bacterium]|nr:nitrous oxide reductase family maturation protein NosD [Planctomycetota bacterium]